MIYTLRFRPEVPLDLASAANWYDNHRQGLGEEFLTEYRLALDGLVQSPLAHASLKIARFWKSIVVVAVNGEFLRMSRALGEDNWVDWEDGNCRGVRNNTRQVPD